MITETILFLIYGFIYIITSPLRLFNDVSLNNNITTSIATVSNNITSLSNYIPLTTILIVFGIVLVIEKYNAIYKGVMWLIKRLPTQS